MMDNVQFLFEISFLKFIEQVNGLDQQKRHSLKCLSECLFKYYINESAATILNR